MLKIIKVTIILILFVWVAACSTTQSPTNTKQNNTAIINTQLGMSYLQHNEVQRAKQKFLLALEQGPTVPEAWYSMAYFLEVTGDKAQAQKYYLKAIELAPQKGESQNNYGTYLCRSGHYQQSIRHFLLAIQDPQYLETASAYENAGLCALKIPDTTLAMQYFNAAITQDPNHPTSLLELAKLDYQQGSYLEAHQRLQEFLALAAPTPESRLLQRQITTKIGG